MVTLLDAGITVAQRGFGGGWWWLGGLLGTVVFLLALGLLAWFVLRLIDRRRPGPTDGARRLLAERFARGEIDQEEYQARLSHL